MKNTILGLVFSLVIPAAAQQTENFNIFDFELGDEDIQAIKRIGQKTR